MNSIIKTDKNGSKYWVIPNIENYKLSYVESNSGTKYWYINGLRHREDGPAVEYNNGVISWYLNDKEIKPTYDMMEKYIRSNPDNILKDYKWPLNIQVLAIQLKPSVIFDIKYPDPKLKKLYPQLYALKECGLI